MASPPSKSRVRVFSFLLATLLSVSASSYIPAAKIPYAEHCSSVVPESAPDSLISDPQGSFHLSSRYFTGGEQILQQNPKSSSSPNSTTLARSWNFNPQYLRRTKTPGILQVEGSLTLFGDQSRSPGLGNLTFASRRTRRRRFYQRKVVRFDLSGFWSDSTGKLCMVGRGFERSKLGNFPQISAVLKLNYPKNSTISTSLVNGTIESLSSKDALNYFNPISLLVYAQKNYKYTLLDKVRDSCSLSDINEESIGFESFGSCSYLTNYIQETFKLEYGSDCSSRSKNCGPFNRSLGFSPKYMSFNQIQCSDDGTFHFSVDFYNGSSASSFRNNALFPERTLVAEGRWDFKNNQLCLMACRVPNIENSTTNPYDCTIGISLRFPAVLSIRSRSSTVGRITSNLNERDSSYFSMISFRSLNSYNYIGSPGLINYNYTETSAVRKYCSKSSVRNTGKHIYPDGNSVRDLMFDASTRNSEGISLWVSAIPLSIGDTFYADPYGSSSTPIDVGTREEIDPHASTETLPAYFSGEMNHTTWNVSYKIRFSPQNSSSYTIEPLEISAEGTYDSSTGAICMIGCQDMSSPFLHKHINNVDSIDCGVLIDIQLAPLNPEFGEHLSGTISSTRAKSDKLYFEALNISSYFMYESVAVESIWRMDIETIMVLVSLTTTCIFIGLQIFHVKKHPNVLPSISFMMLLILTLGHMIPLVLNVEALFSTRYRSGVVWLGDGWFEANEIIVRATTMVAFLLQCRLLQLSWSARSSEEGKRGFWVAELKALFCSLPLYIFVGLIAWLFDLVSYGARQQRSYINADAGLRRSLSGYLISCAGLLLDGFLLPQVILNIFSGSTKDTILAPSFYLGNTGVRAMPHVYDAYRAHHYNPYVNSTYIYASPVNDFYSNAWDIIVPCGGMLLAVIIFLQQRFGGGCVLPSRFRKSGGYTIVSEIGL